MIQDPAVKTWSRGSSGNVPGLLTLLDMPSPPVVLHLAKGLGVPVSMDRGKCTLSLPILVPQGKEY